MIWAFIVGLLVGTMMGYVLCAIMIANGGDK